MTLYFITQKANSAQSIGNEHTRNEQSEDPEIGDVGRPYCVRIEAEILWERNFTG